MLNLTNLLIRVLAHFHPPIDGNPKEWREKQYNKDWREFICGSVKGLYRTKDREYQVLAVMNTKSNDNFYRMLEWFEKSCKRDNYALTFLEVGNPKLEQKLRGLGFVGTKKKLSKNYKV